VELVLLEDGSLVIISDVKDIVDIIDERMGLEFATVVSKLITQTTAENDSKIMAKARANTDAEAYEAELDSAMDILREIKEEVYAVKELISQKRINKEKVLNGIGRIIKQVGYYV